MEGIVDENSKEEGRRRWVKKGSRMWEEERRKRKKEKSKEEGRRKWLVKRKEREVCRRREIVVAIEKCEAEI